MTDEELDAMEARGKDPLNSFEDARDGLETLGADVVRLIGELRDERRMHRLIFDSVMDDAAKSNKQARLWRALAQTRIDPKHDCRMSTTWPHNAKAHEAAEKALRDAGIDPDAP